MVAILILNYNNAADTIQCIKSLEKYNTAPSKYVIIDNGSQDDSVLVLNRWLAEHFGNRYKFAGLHDEIGSYSFKAILIQTLENRGYACGNNYGLNLIEKDSEVNKILILNNDILFTSDIIPKLSSFLDTHSDAAIVCPLLYKKDGATIDYNCARYNCTISELLWLYLLQSKPWFGILKKYKEKHYCLHKSPDLLHKDCFTIELPSGSCMLIEKEYFKQIGYFDSNTFLYYEENILFKKIEKTGRKNYILPQVSCIHIGAATTSVTKKTLWQTLQTCSSAYYYARHYSGMNFLQKSILYCLYKVYMTKLTLTHRLKLI